MSQTYEKDGILTQLQAEKQKLEQILKEEERQYIQKTETLQANMTQLTNEIDAHKARFGNMSVAHPSPRRTLELTELSCEIKRAISSVNKDSLVKVFSAMNQSGKIKWSKTDETFDNFSPLFTLRLPLIRLPLQ